MYNRKNSINKENYSKLDRAINEYLQQEIYIYSD